MGSRAFLSAVLGLCLLACKTTYEPREYRLRDGLISPIPLRGTASFENLQTAPAPTLVYSFGGSQSRSDLKAITEVMVKQASGELAKAASDVQSGETKTIGLRVTSLVSRYIAWFFKSEMRFEVKLGDAEPVERTVRHGSADVTQDLNGCIAEGVMVLLNDPEVRAYLAR